MLLRRLALAALALCATVAFNRPTFAQDIAADSPKGAAQQFFKAMESGDATAAKTVATGSDKQLAMLDLLVPVISGFKQLENAAVKKWGEDARKTLSQNGGGAGLDFEKQLKASTEKIDGDNATITSSNPEQQREPMKLKKVNGKWKVDMSSMPAENMDNPNTAKMLRLMSDAAKATATEVDQGKYATADEAKKAMGQKIIPALMQMQQQQQQQQQPQGPGAPGAGPGTGAPGAAPGGAPQQPGTDKK
jgi:hypothetical protein